MPDRIIPPDGISVRRWRDSARLSTLRSNPEPDADPVNIFVVEDAPEIRKRLIAMVCKIAGVNVIGEADSVNAAIDGVLGGATDTLLLDLQLKDGMGLDVLTRVKQVRPGLHVIVLTNFATPQYRQASLSAGADFCLDKSRDFGLVGGILRNWIEADDDRPIA